MNGVTIRKILKNDPAVSQSFLGVFPSDKVPTNACPTPCSVVANTDASGKPGQHWIAMHIDGSRNGFFFDSYGRAPELKPFRDFLLLNCGENWTFNEKMLQNPLVSTCGQFCVYFLIFVCRGHTLAEIVSSFDESSDKDQAVVDFVNDSFRVDTEVYDEEFIVNQICRAMQQQ